jgi:hypothetical protein
MLSGTINTNGNYSSPPVSPSKCIEIKNKDDLNIIKLKPSISFDKSCSNNMFDPSKMSPPNNFMEKLIARREKYN